MPTSNMRDVDHEILLLIFNIELKLPCKIIQSFEILIGRIAIPDAYLFVSHLRLSPNFSYAISLGSHNSILLPSKSIICKNFP